MKYNELVFAFLSACVHNYFLLEIPEAFRLEGS